MANLKKMLGVEEIRKEDLPPINPLQLPKLVDQLLGAVSSAPKVKSNYPETEENQ